jgi:proteasome accessory factor C
VTPHQRGGQPRASADRLGRLLNLVPYLLARPGIAVADAADGLGITERQLREDLELLWVCGLPGYGPGDLIDMALDGDRVTITYDAGIDRPLRLTQDEALALVVALRLSAPWPRSRMPPVTWRTRRSRSGCPATTSGWTRSAARSSGGTCCT